jgi:hypothetical protein
MPNIWWLLLQIHAAVDSMQRELRGQRGNFVLQPPQAAICKFQIPRSLMLRITGRNGGSLQGIRSSTGAQLNVDDAGDAPSVVITGSMQQVKDAYDRCRWGLLLPLPMVAGATACMCGQLQL